MRTISEPCLSSSVKNAILTSVTALGGDEGEKCLLNDSDSSSVIMRLD